MKTNLTTIVATLAAMACAATSVVAQSPAASNGSSPFAGTWEGKMNNLPGIDLKVEEAAGKISGAMVFYFQERTDTNGPWHVTAEHRVPLLSPRVDGKTLTFEVEHHICHDCVELGPNAELRVELVGPNEARLWKLDEEVVDEARGSGLKLLRRAPPKH